jgi:hypothetical protein
MQKAERDHFLGRHRFVDGIERYAINVFLQEIEDRFAAF